MSYNGSGTFQINTSGQPVVAGTVISSTAFNALTADLATGLSTAITKDGQTATTARIPFAAGISSTLVTDSTSVSTGSIITAGGVGIAKAAYVGTTLAVTGSSTFTGAIAVDSVIDSTSTTTGSIQTDGGVGIAKALYVGTTANIAGVLSTTSPNITTSITTPSTSFDLINATATTLNLGGAATAVNVGAATGTMTVANTTLAAKAITASTTLSVTGVTTVQAGTAALPAITTTGDTNTGIFFPAADTIAFTEGGAEAMRIDSSGNVGIGTVSPIAPLHISNGAASAPAIYLQNGNKIGFTAAQSCQFGTWNGTTYTENMRIDSSGNLLVGTTSQTGRLAIQQSDSGAPACRIYASSATFADNAVIAVADRNTTNASFYFYSAYNNTVAAYKFRVADSGNVTNTNNSYGAISDSKLKENVVDATPKLEKLNQVRIVNFNMIGDGQKQIGVIAQEIEQIFPSMVDESSDRDAKGNDLGTTTKTVKYSVFVPILIKAIQEQQALITALTARITALENK